MSVDGSKNGFICRFPGPTPGRAQNQTFKSRVMENCKDYLLFVAFLAVLAGAVAFIGSLLYFDLCTLLGSIITAAAGVLLSIIAAK